ncbi:hypothetical protein Pmani_025486 [Petrolisthes manimaculis]|uniref:Zinc finger CCCH-type with G patch domain-containing protein n=1 Tax=Petrolisthes manimaculis TaxID=1843537 RepID=A0AAE1P7V1_9EUCA|nr:hypothetical protein Pmani_025486 [Petrolisthes manimaculis]
MTTKELLASIEVYQVQLQQIEGALATAEDEEKIQLQELQANLLQLLDLSLQQLTQQPQDIQKEKQHDSLSTQDHSKPKTTNEDSSQTSTNEDNNETNKIDDEFALFQAEIEALSEDKEESVAVSEDKEETETFLEDEEENIPNSKLSCEALERLVGSQCRAPFTERWGGHTYHNAVILNLVTSEDGEPDLDEPQVRVLFTQPTSLEMLTCRFFLSDRCKYSEEGCRFSHGMTVAATDIKEYREPDFDSVVPGSRVLVQQEGSDLWKVATVQDILEDRSAFSVAYHKNKEVKEVKPQDVFPLQYEEDIEKEDEDEKVVAEELMDSDTSDDEATVFVPSSTWLQHSLTTRLGEWEKHTKGIGSKLMSKMGYVVGTGLGREGEGRVEPVVAYVYPQGVSLDRCMELREASNGEELLQVEKRLEREKRKEEAKSAQTAERLRKRTSVFDIINNKLGGKGTATGSSDNSEPEKPAINVSKSTLRADSTRDLNLKNHQLGGNIRLLQREIDKIEETQRRQTGDKRALSVISARLETKKNELRRLQEAERKVQTEQQSRKDTKKLCVF